MSIIPRAGDAADVHPRLLKAACSLPGTAVHSRPPPALVHNLEISGFRLQSL
jgi:hypothetical protein